MERHYNELTPELTERILSDREEAGGIYLHPKACKNTDVLRRREEKGQNKLWRPEFVKDVERVLHDPFYNRYADKTQVFSFTHNDDITRRAQHVQLVARIARNIGGVLGLNQDLIEAIGLAHDIGHTPFGHVGERYLDELYEEHTGLRFAHNVHSVRVLDGIFLPNMSLQVLDGALCHNGEIELQEFHPDFGKTFRDLDREVQSCYEDISYNKVVRPTTLEGCVVRVSDMIAYLGKDRQDAEKAFDFAIRYEDRPYLGTSNGELINNLIVDVIENSYGKDYIALSEEGFAELSAIKAENYQKIYGNPDINKEYETMVRPAFRKVYGKLLEDVIAGQVGGKRDTPVWKHHVRHVEAITKRNPRGPRYPRNDGTLYDIAPAYSEEEPNRIVVDYIASMTDDYFLDLYERLFDEPSGIVYKSYFSSKT